MDFLRGWWHALLRLVLGPARFAFWERRGLHIVPVSEMEPIPDTRSLAPAIWSTASDLVGIELGEAAQLELLDELERRFSAEYSALPSRSTAPNQFFLENRYFPPVDAKVLYGMLRRHRPRRVREVGAGYSTLLMAQALRRNEAEDSARRCDYVAIDPHPARFSPGGVPELTRLIARPLQEVPLEEFTCLREDDLLFIDSSHVVKTGSDVQRLFLEILPRLSPGVLVHVHDVFLPFDYPREWVVDEHRFWNEQYLLQAFLIGNRDFEVLWAGQFLSARHPERLERAFQSTAGGSFWMRRRTR